VDDLNCGSEESEQVDDVPYVFSSEVNFPAEVTGLNARSVESGFTNFALQSTVANSSFTENVCDHNCPTFFFVCDDKYASSSSTVTVQKQKII
jgi:hypothetical protein